MGKNKKMRNAPVYFTIAQVRFNPVLNMEGYLAAIQEKMRKIHFPDFKRQVIQKLIVPFASPGNEAQIPAPSFAPQARCIFGNIEGTTEFVLENNSFSLHTTAYDTFDVFSSILFNGLGIVHEVIQLDFTERIGLRYLDAVLPKTGETLDAYLTPEVLGLSNKLKGKLLHSVNENITINATGQMISRVIIRDGHIGLPPELMPLAPPIDQRFTQPDGRHSIIDTDAFVEKREVFDLKKIEATLLSLHEVIDESFRATITSHAITVWQ